MEKEQSFLETGLKYIYLSDATEDVLEQAVSGDKLRSLIYKIDGPSISEELYMLEGAVIENTGLFVYASFVTKDGNIDYCFQCGRDNEDGVVSTLVKVINHGPASIDQHLFRVNYQTINDSNELLEAQYLATYKNGKWLILDESDRKGKLDCESQAVLSRAKKFVF